MRNDELAGLERKYPFPPSEIKRMRARQWIMSYAMKRGVGAEIGVFRGHFSVHLIETLKPTKIYLIDPWTKTGEYFKFSAPYSNDGKLPTEVAFREARLRTNHFDDTAIQFIEGYFLEQIDQIKEKLDWVYLDASRVYLNTNSTPLTPAMPRIAIRRRARFTNRRTSGATSSPMPTPGSRTMSSGRSPWFFRGFR